MTAVNGLNTWEIRGGSNTGLMFIFFCYIYKAEAFFAYFLNALAIFPWWALLQRIGKRIKKCTVVGFARHLGHLFKLVGLKEPTLSNEHNLNGFILALSWF